MGLRDLWKGFNRKDDVEAALESADVPTFPAVCTQALGMLRDPDMQAPEVAAVIEHDPGLQVRILRLVNSAASGFRTEIASTAKAVALLGTSRVETLVLSCAVQDALPEQPAPGFDGQAFWTTAARRACLARAIARRIDRPTEGEAFTAALLQDIGVPVLAASKGEAYVGVYDRWRSGDVAELTGAERDAFGLDHQGIGATLAERWGLPEYLVQAIGSHHSPEAENLSVAVRVAAHVRDATDGDGTTDLTAPCQEATGLDAAQAVELIAAAMIEAEDFARALR